MKILEIAHKIFINKIVSSNKEWGVRKFTKEESIALFEVRSYAAAVKISKIGFRNYYVTTYPNSRLNCLHIHIGWFNPNDLPSLERIPRESQIQANINDAILQHVNSDAAKLLINHPHILPNQSQGSYLWYPHAPEIYQNSLVPMDYELLLDDNNQRDIVLSNCEKVTDLMFQFYNQAIINYFNIIDDKYSSFIR